LNLLEERHSLRTDKKQPLGRRDILSRDLVKKMPINCSIGEKHQISYSFSMFHQFDLVVSTADQIGETW